MYCTIGFLPTGSISFGCDFVAGSKRVPKPATGMTAFRIGTITPNLKWAVGSGQWAVDRSNLPTAHCPLPTAHLSSRRSQLHREIQLSKLELIERCEAVVARHSAQLLFDPQQLVVFRDAVGARRRTGLDLSG